MERVSIIIEVDGREKMRLSLTSAQVADFSLHGKLSFSVDDFKNFDQHSHGKIGSYYISTEYLIKEVSGLMAKSEDAPTIP